jgi:hypothetical protein
MPIGLVCDNDLCNSRVELTPEEQHSRKLSLLRESIDKLRVSFEEIDFRYRDESALRQSDDGNVRMQSFYEKQMNEIQCLQQLLKHDLSGRCWPILYTHPPNQSQTH